MVDKTQLTPEQILIDYYSAVVNSKNDIERAQALKESVDKINQYAEGKKITKKKIVVSDEDANAFIGFTMYDLFEHGYLNQKGADFINNSKRENIQSVNEPFFQEVARNIRDFVKHQINGEVYP